VLPGGSAVVDAWDVAIGMLRIAQIGRSGERYILSGGFAELADIVANLAALTGGKPPKSRISFLAAIALATAAETWSRITGNDSLMPVEAIRLMNARLCVTAAKAEKEHAHRVVGVLVEDRGIGLGVRPIAVIACCNEGLRLLLIVALITDELQDVGVIRVEDRHIFAARRVFPPDLMTPANAS
jgi:hypothetical protein